MRRVHNYPLVELWSNVVMSNVQYICLFKFALLLVLYSHWSHLIVLSSTLIAVRTSIRFWRLVLKPIIIFGNVCFILWSTSLCFLIAPSLCVSKSLSSHFLKSLYCSRIMMSYDSPHDSGLIAWPEDHPSSPREYFSQPSLNFWPGFSQNIGKIVKANRNQ